MLREPTMSLDDFEYDPSRTSVPSLLYGRAHSIHFDNFPADIQSDAPFVRTVIRATLILALPITFLMLGELVRRALALLWARPKRDLHEALLTIACLGFLGFQVAYALRLRDFSTIKTIFLFPALPGFASALVAAMETLTQRRGSRAPVVRAVELSCKWLPTLYLADLFSALASLALARLSSA
jgi:hypothetical protein